MRSRFAVVATALLVPLIVGWMLDAPPAAAESIAKAPSYSIPLEPYKATYFLPLTKDSANHSGQDERQPEEVKFQLSFRIRLYPWESDGSEFPDIGGIDTAGVFIGYTQKSQWQLYDKAHSAPFRENNYNPEFFVTAPDWNLGDGWVLNGQVGVEHESNGQDLPLSRSWNRNYLQPKVRFPAWGTSVLTAFKYWQRWEEPDGRDVTDPSRDDNPDIWRYLGHWELSLTAPFQPPLQAKPPPVRVSMMLRNYFNPRKYGTSEVNLDFWPIRRTYFRIQYFDGYGESLIDYNHRVTRWGFGFVTQ